MCVMFALFFYTNSFPFCFIAILTMSNTYFTEHSLTPVGRIWGESCTYCDVIVQAQIIFLVTGELSPASSKRLRRPVKAAESGKTNVLITLQYIYFSRAMHAHWNELEKCRGPVGNSLPPRRRRVEWPGVNYWEAEDMQGSLGTTDNSIP